MVTDQDPLLLPPPNKIIDNFRVDMASASAPVDVVRVVVVLADGNNIIHRAEVELRSFDSSGEPHRGRREGK